MNGKVETIERRYNVYLAAYPKINQSMFDEYDYPLQGAILSENASNVSYHGPGGKLERNCLVQRRDDIPDISELPKDALGWLPIGLTDILKIQRTPDHDATWKTTANKLENLNSETDVFPRSIVQNFKTLVRAVICTSWEPTSLANNDWSDETLENYLIRDSSILARYMAFPTLEGILKYLIKEDIKPNGEVRSGRTVKSYSGKDYTEGCTVSDFGHLLWHLEQEVADDTLKSRMEDFCRSVESFFRIEDDSNLGGYGYLSNQRNSSLHGQARAQAESGILLNLISLLILNIDHIPEEMWRPPE